MYYLALGLACLLTVAFAGGRHGWAAAALGLAAFGYAFFVYRSWVPPAAAAVAALAGFAASRLASRRPRLMMLLLGAGTVLAAFSVLGPRDGLF
jgi:integral membrane sensor domain MASE1